jgi:hypothetical protein
MHGLACSASLLLRLELQGASLRIAIALLRSVLGRKKMWGTPTRPGRRCALHQLFAAVYTTPRFLPGSSLTFWEALGNTHLPGRRQRPAPAFRTSG